MKQTLLAAIIILAFALFAPAQRTDKPQEKDRAVVVKVSDLKPKPRQRLLLRIVRVIAWAIFHKGEIVDR